MKTFFFAVTVLAALAIGVCGCTKPKAPTLVPKEVTVTAVDLTGFDMRVKMDAFNPNGFTIAVRSIVAHVIVDGTQDLGTVTASEPINLPPNVHTLIDVPMNVKWKGVGGLATLAKARKPIPYTVDGTATVGGETLNVDVPFKLEGKITPEQVQQAMVKSIQAIPGLPGIQGLPPIPLPR
jgi:LEA14-like dessication related protein